MGNSAKIVESQMYALFSVWWKWPLGLNYPLTRKQKSWQCRPTYKLQIKLSFLHTHL